MDARLSKLRYRAWHRGFREADLILGPFADLHVERLDADQLDDFEQLLEQPDQDLFGWIIGQTAPPADLAAGILGSIIEFRFEARAALGDRGA